MTPILILHDYVNAVLVSRTYSGEQFHVWYPLILGLLDFLSSGITECNWLDLLALLVECLAEPVLSWLLETKDERPGQRFGTRCAGAGCCLVLVLELRSLPVWCCVQAPGGGQLCVKTFLRGHCVPIFRCKTFLLSALTGCHCAPVTGIAPLIKNVPTV